MGEVNLLYKEKSLAYLIYDSWRCGIVHQATLKKGFGASSYMYGEDKHLYYIEDKNIIFVHPLRFADDFINAQKMYREHINSNRVDAGYIESLYNHLQNMMKDDNVQKNQYLSELIKILKNKNLVFNSSDAAITAKITPHTSTVTQLQSSLHGTITCPPNDNELFVEPSRAPNDNDLK